MYWCNVATQIFPSHRGDKITCSPPPSMTQLRGGCLKAVTLTLSSILPNHPPTGPPSRGEQDRGRQAEREVVKRDGGWRRGGRERRRRRRTETTNKSETLTRLVERPEFLQHCLLFSRCLMTQWRKNEEDYLFFSFFLPQVCWVRTQDTHTHTHTSELACSCVEIKYHTFTIHTWTHYLRTRCQNQWKL